MSKLTKDLPDTFFDTRTRQRYMNKGLISSNDYENYLKALPNDEENFELAPFEDDLDLTDESSEESSEA